MQQNSSQTVSWGAVRHRAGEFLSTGENRLLLVGCVSILLVFVALYSTVIYTFVTILSCFEMGKMLFEALIAFFLIFLVGLTFLFTLPMLYGSVFVAFRITVGQRAFLTDLFYMLSSHRVYARFLVLSAPMGFRLLWLALGCLLSCRGIPLLGLPVLMEKFLVPCCCALLALLFCARSCRDFGTLYAAFRTPECSAQEIRRVMRKQKKQAFEVGSRYFFGFLPHILLGLVTFGLLLLADVVPRMLLTYCLGFETVEHLQSQSI